MACLTRFLILLDILLVPCISLGTPLDSTSQQRFQQLAEKMRLKAPSLKEGDYEIRIWNNQALRYGDAQMLYVLIKKEALFTVSKYVIESNGQGFKYAIQLNPNPKIPIDNRLWEKFVQQGITDLPDMSAIHDKLYPKPPKDSTWSVVEADGSVSVKAKRRDTNWIIIGDGEGYYVDVFTANNYRSYGYSNPREYLAHRPDIVELQKIVSILNNLAILFRSSN